MSDEKTSFYGWVTNGPYGRGVHFTAEATQAAAIIKAGKKIYELDLNKLGNEIKKISFEKKDADTKIEYT